MTIRIGTSGWSYDHWDGVLYRPGLPPHERLARYVEEFDTVELNASFYRWPRDRSFASWRQRLPEGFTMSVKASRGLTHARRLYGPEVWSERIARAWHELRGRREAVLVQLRPDAQRDDARLDWFLGCLPDWVQVAVELRHPSWQTDAVFDLLARHGAAYCVVSGAGIPCVLRATSRLVYVRLHGPDHHHLYAGSYSDDDLRWWADRLREWEGAGHDVVAYFNNDGGGNAVRNAWTLRGLLA
ncbi:DUF72 domain-containing protein [Cellulomonas sp. zg-ZUI22]|uniref:DUF72 domain-containing protein n=1 Tax=Cellulomonas sp. zg-ZUI22 TaxID=2816955 RepID=UPI001A94B4E7|nr:DUF72 domain-containing protein [Cellulomonas sp. zg-ZUI22]MBO0899322.1 DUF72 domain-containing protein [Cellulomonas sp. zg-ZUI22]